MRTWCKTIALLAGLLVVDAALAAESPWRVQRTAELVSRDTGGGLGNAHSGAPEDPNDPNRIEGQFRALSISDDGSRVLFDSMATDLTADTLSDANWHVFLRDRSMGSTSWQSPDLGCEVAESFSPGDRRSSQISGDGNVIVYGGSRDPNNNSVVIVRRTLSPATAVCLSNLWGAACYAGRSEPIVPDDGADVAYISACEGEAAAFVHAPYNVAPDFLRCHEDPDVVTLGLPNVEFSGNGEWVFYTSNCLDPNRPVVLAAPVGEPNSPTIISKTTGGVTANHASGAHGFHRALWPSDDGRYVVFSSRATNLPGASSRWQIYLHDRDTDNDDVFDESGAFSTTLISRSLCSGDPADADCFWPSIFGRRAVHFVRNAG